MLFKRRRPRAVAGRPSCGVRAECTGFDAVRARLWARDSGYSGLHPERRSGAGRGRPDRGHRVGERDRRKSIDKCRRDDDMPKPHRKLDFICM